MGCIIRVWVVSFMAALNWGWGILLWAFGAKPFTNTADTKLEAVFRRDFWRRSVGFQRIRFFGSNESLLVVSGHFKTWRRQTGSSLSFAFWVSPAKFQIIGTPEGPQPSSNPDGHFTRWRIQNWKLYSDGVFWSRLLVNWLNCDDASLSMWSTDCRRTSVSGILERISSFHRFTHWICKNK